MSPRSADITAPGAFESILRETIAEVETAEAIEATDAQQAQDDIERLRLQAAHLVSAQNGGPWHTGAARQFVPDPATAMRAHTTMDIRCPGLPSRQAEPVEAGPRKGGRGRGPQRQGRRAPNGPVTGG